VVCSIVLVDDMRRKMRKLWESVVSAEHGLDPLTQMIFYPNAAAIDELERPEVLSLLPDIERRDILELGAGIGQVFLCRILLVEFTYTRRTMLATISQDKGF